jgi:hypothetical protein
MNFGDPVDPDDVPDEPTAGSDLAKAGGAGLKALGFMLPEDEGYDAAAIGSVSVFGKTSARLAPILDALPGLRELHVEGDGIFLESSPGQPVSRDLRGVRGWPPGLTKLCIQPDFIECVVTLPPVIAARLESLIIKCAPPETPPACLADPACDFTRLTRLAYGGSTRASLNLAPWSDPSFHLPNLAEMEITVWSVTLEGGLVGQAWAEAVVKNLPRLAVLKLVPWEIRNDEN